MSSAVVLVAETAEQIDAVRALFRAYGRHLSEKANICVGNLDAEIASLPAPYLLLLLATVDESPAGCVALKGLSQSGERACELKRLWVAPAFRGQGMGKRLMEAAIAQATRLGHTALYLDTVPAAMLAAIRLYGTLGFQPVDRYNDNPVADVAFFRVALSPALKTGEPV